MSAKCFVLKEGSYRHSQSRVGLKVFSPMGNHYVDMNHSGAITALAFQ